MSLPRQIAAHSSSPSKSSLRRTSGPQNPSARGLLPSPHFEDDPIVASHRSPPPPDPAYEQAIGEESENNALSLFQPFFALVEDSVTNEHYHPTVHYIFADDDADIVAEAACRSLEQLDPSQRPVETEQSTLQSAPHHDDLARLPLPVPGVREHYLILDVQPASRGPEGLPPFEVTQAQCLSAEWQVLRTSVSNAPTIGDGNEDDCFMLRIEGRGNATPDAAAGGRDRTEKESMEEMIERFQKRLDDIRQVIQASSDAQRPEQNL